MPAPHALPGLTAPAWCLFPWTGRLSPQGIQRLFQCGQWRSGGRRKADSRRRSHAGSQMRRCDWRGGGAAAPTAKKAVSAGVLPRGAAPASTRHRSGGGQAATSSTVVQSWEQGKDTESAELKLIKSCCGAARPRLHQTPQRRRPGGHILHCCPVLRETQKSQLNSAKAEMKLWCRTVPSPPPPDTAAPAARRLHPPLSCSPARGSKSRIVIGMNGDAARCGRAATRRRPCLYQAPQPGGNVLHGRAVLAAQHVTFSDTDKECSQR